MSERLRRYPCGSVIRYPRIAFSNAPTDPVAAPELGLTAMGVEAIAGVVEAAPGVETVPPGGPRMMSAATNKAATATSATAKSFNNLG
jgi:hypothetical protein